MVTTREKLVPITPKKIINKSKYTATKTHQNMKRDFEKQGPMNLQND